MDDPDFSWDGGDFGQLDGKQVDWDGWVARVSKAQLLQIIDDFYGTESDVHQGESEETHVRTLRHLLDFVRGLSDTDPYALVACEL
ncbi:MAG: hypothetical protein ABIP55_12100 [Tepidisphaeraceae bacterium]